MPIAVPAVRRLPVALAAVLLLAGPPPAEAGRGKMGRTARIERGPNGQVTYRETIKHTKGIRARLTGRRLGKVISIENSQRGGEAMSRVQRRRQRVTKTTTAARAGTRSSSVNEKKGLLSRKWRTKMTRNDLVRTSSVDELSSRRRMFGRELQTARRTGEMGNSQLVERKVNRRGQVTSERVRASGRTGPAFTRKLEGRRTIESRRSGMEVTDTFTRKWGVLSRLTNGRLGKKVTVEHRQGADGTSITMTSPRQTFRRDTVVGDGWTESTGSYSKRNRVFGRTLRERQRDKVTTDASGVVRRTESLRRDGSVKKIVTERVMADGRTRVTTTRLRRDGTARTVKEKETVEHPSGKRSRRAVRSVRRWVGRDGSTRFGVGRAKVGGKRSAFVETPVGAIGRPVGRITSAPPRRQLAASGDSR